MSKSKTLNKDELTNSLNNLLPTARKIHEDKRKLLKSLKPFLKKKHRKILTSYPIEDLVLIMTACKKPQSLNFVIEDYIRIRMGGTKNKSEDECGDFHANGEDYENKSSVIDDTNKYFNMVQIRPEQDVKYTGLVIDLRDLSRPKVDFFVLSKEQMINERSQIKEQNAHGVGLGKKEKALRIDVNKDHFSRWKKTYKQDIPNYKDTQ